MTVTREEANEVARIVGALTLSLSRVLDPAARRDIEAEIAALERLVGAAARAS